MRLTFDVLKLRMRDNRNDSADNIFLDWQVEDGIVEFFFIQEGLYDIEHWCDTERIKKIKKRLMFEYFINRQSENYNNHHLY